MPPHDPSQLLPPLEDPAALVARSERLAEIPGLREAAVAWQAEGVRRRTEIAREAERLATPRLWTDTVGALAKRSWRIAKVAAPDAPIALLTAAAGSTGFAVGPAGSWSGTIERAQKLVRAGGPAFVKLGQFVATGDGLLPQEWVDAFAWCRDEAPPMRPGRAASIVRRELPAGALASLDPVPLASGSIGQVHRGVLADGRAVVVKVRRPRLAKRLRADVASLALVAAGAERFNEPSRQANLSGFTSLFAQLVLEELDFRLEAANLVEGSAVLEAMGADEVFAPRPIPGLVTERVLVMEAMPGVSYARLAPDSSAREDGERTLTVGVRAVIEATLMHGVFHGDLHAGNVLIDDRARFSLVDFGICGRLDDRGRQGLVDFLIGFATHDAAKQVDALRGFGALHPTDDDAELIARLQVQLDRLAARDGGAITFDRMGDTLGRLLRVASQGGMTLPKDLVLFFKNVLYLSGFAAAVAPDADVLSVVQGIVGDMVARGMGDPGADAGMTSPSTELVHVG